MIRRLFLGLAGALIATLAILLVMVGLSPVDSAGSSAPAGREGGFDQPRVTATSTPPQTPSPRVAPAESEPAPPAAPAGADPAEAEVLSLVNSERTASGCAAIAWDETLAQVARLHSADMAARDYLDHTNPDGLTPFDRAAAAGTTASAENVAAGQQTAADVMAAWMASPGHRANILNCGLTRIGVGVGHGGSYGITWTQLFGS